MELKLEVRKDVKLDKGILETKVGRILITPPIDEGFWYFRVKLSKKQAIVGFPKFCTIGIGFAVEKDWNTNLPFTSGAREIFNHIAHNKKYKTIKDKDCIKAIEMIQDIAKKYKE